MRVPRLVLASGSPRRRELLTVAGYKFEVDAADIDECIHEGESPVAATTRLAIEKAEAVAQRRAAAETAGAAPELVLAADTTVVVGERILGKPGNESEAVEMLLSLAGRNHIVLTAWALVHPNAPNTPNTPNATGARPEPPECGISRSTVRMREISFNHFTEFLTV